MGDIKRQSAPAAQQSTVVLPPITLQTSVDLQQKFDGTDAPHCISDDFAHVGARSKRFRI